MGARTGSHKGQGHVPLSRKYAGRRGPAAEMCRGKKRLVWCSTRIWLGLPLSPPPSLDVALDLIQSDRDSLKRVESFKGYPGTYGHKVRETIEELFILLLQTLSERHIAPGFQKATEQMRTYQPAEHEETRSVAPLLQFFELVHVGDTIQSMVQVYFDKELVGGPEFRAVSLEC